MNSKSKYAILLLSSVLVIYAIVGGMLGRVSAQDGSYPQLSIFTEVLDRIRGDYVDEPELTSALEGAIRGMIERVDPYGGYLSPEEVAFYNAYDPYETPGIGAILAKPPQVGYPVIVSAIPGGPAARADLGTGDVIESINGITTQEMNLVQVNFLLSTPAGEPVELIVIRRRRAAPETLSLNREVTPAPPVTASMVGTIAHIEVPYLAPGKAAEARTRLDALIGQGATGVVLDLRYSAGGEETEAVELANLFLDSGNAGYVEGQKIERRTLNTDPAAALTDLPLVVLVNQGTAGPAEVAAGAIADHRRGQLVGTETFGLGSIQQLIPMEGGSGLLLSVAKYYTPSGTEIEERGLQPDHEVLQASEELFNPDEEVEQPDPAEGAEDRQLQKALELLAAQAIENAA